VQVATDDGENGVHTVLWKRKNAPSYEIDGQKFDRLKGAGLPEALHQALRMPLVEGAGEDDFDVHIGAQKSPIFLLASPSATAARFFASSSDASRLVAMQKRHKDKLAERQREKNRLEAESKQLTAELESLEPTALLDRQLKAAEQEHAELLRLAAELEQAQRTSAAIEWQQTAVTNLSAVTGSLSPLASPPMARPTEPLARLIGGMERARSERAHAAARVEQLSPLPSPPQLFDVAALARTIDQLSALNRAAARAEAEQQQLTALQPPPEVAETAGRQELIGRLSGATSQVQRWQAAVQATDAMVIPPQPPKLDSLRDLVARLETATKQVAATATEQTAAIAQMGATAEALVAAAEGEACPTCGAPLDAESLLARAASGQGGHGHD
jgi:exonuclease SbcC